MLDFVEPAEERPNKSTVIIYPRFLIKKSKDLMIRGGDFYAIWVEDKHRWSTEEDEVTRQVDKIILDYAEKKYGHTDEVVVKCRLMKYSDSGAMDKWRAYTQKHMRDNFHELDDELTFQGEEMDKKKYSSHSLPYVLAPGEHTNWDRLMDVLYSPEEKRKIEWAIGCIVSGDSKTVQKFLVLHGAGGTGKSTVINIMEWLFEGYFAPFKSRALGDPNNQFALEPLKNNPLVAIEHDGNLAYIEDNTTLNSIISHEVMPINAKYSRMYSSKFRSFLVVGTNKPVKITDAKSGIIRRLIDAHPTGNLIPRKEYDKLMAGIKFELGAIAKHCLDIYKEDPGYYDDYVSIEMIGATNDFFNFVENSYMVFSKEGETTLKAAWDMYKIYCEDAKVPYMKQPEFKEELKNYFEDYKERVVIDGVRIRNLYTGFRKDKFESKTGKKKKQEAKPWLIFEDAPSLLDEELKDCPAQYAANYSGTSDQPEKAWSKCKTKLSDIDTHKLHYILPPIGHIFVDFDIPDENGNKSLEKNLEAASKWPPTYAELSKSGQGIHLHYIYMGDVSNLSNIYGDHIEIKFRTEGSLFAMRRLLSKCCNLPIATLTSGLPEREEKVLDFKKLKDEKHLRNVVKKYLRKEVEGAESTHQSMSLIKLTLDEAYESGMVYDISDMYTPLFTFAISATNQPDACIKLLNEMKLASEKEGEQETSDDTRLVFFDCEVFPNLLLINWKFAGDSPMVRMINPSSVEVGALMELNLVGFNNLRYDNHILYARHLGYDNEQIYRLSQALVSGNGKAGFREAKNVSYTDIYDFSSVKQSLKQFEIDMHFKHKELGLPWDEPVPEDMWQRVSEYCDNDVLATEALFNTPDRQADFLARQILADVAGLTVNDTTNTLTTQIIFGNDKNPQSQFNYRNLGDIAGARPWTFTPDNVLFDNFEDPYILFDEQDRPVFPGYKFEYDPDKKKAISTYRGEEVGEGGYVYAEPGMYGNVALLDIKSMHPSSVVAEQLFGEKYTKRFKELKDARVAIKEKRYSDARLMLDGALAKYIDRVESGELSNKVLAGALKIAINSVYGLTAAKFDNKFRDVRNKDNIVAKRGALFMVNLKHAVQSLGYRVVHIKTDSIKIADATPEIIEFVNDFGKMYGYEFDHEATYERICLVNDAVYIARYKNADGSLGDWTATGAQFQVPYVFKTLFSKEPLEFYDKCLAKSVSNPAAIYLDMNEDNPDEHNYIFVGRVGEFCPMKKGGGVLLRGVLKNGEMSYSAISGSKGYRFLESETVQALGKEEDIDNSYFQKMANDAIESIKTYGDYEWFVSEDPYIPTTLSDGTPIIFD